MLRRCVPPKRADSSSFADRRFHFGATENAGVENVIRAKLQGWKMQEWKMREYIAGVEMQE